MLVATSTGGALGSSSSSANTAGVLQTQSDAQKGVRAAPAPAPHELELLLDQLIEWAPFLDGRQRTRAAAALRQNSGGPGENESGQSEVRLALRFDDEASEEDADEEDVPLEKPLTPVASDDEEDEEPLWTDADGRLMQGQEPLSPVGAWVAAGRPERPDDLMEIGTSTGEVAEDGGVCACGFAAAECVCEALPDEDVPAQREAITHTARNRRRRGRQRRGGRDGGGGGSGGLNLAGGREIFCDHCECGGTAEVGSCILVAMLADEAVNSVIAQYQNQLELWGSAEPDDDHAQARHAFYKAAVGWRLGDRLGAGKRFKLPDCCMRKIRVLFPYSGCDPAVCDYLCRCEREGHYVPFRTAAESKAAREGRVLIELDD